ncbi:HSP20-like chaperone [Aspergillus similis]
MLKLVQSRVPARISHGYHHAHLAQSPFSQYRTMSSLMHGRPAGGLLSLMRALDDFDSSLANRSLDNQFAAYAPRFDLRETKDSYHLDGELPGVEKEDLNIEFPDRSTLNIRGHSEASASRESAEGTWWCVERSTGDFRRSFNFPTPVDCDHVDATLKNGILSIKIPKSEEAPTGKRIDIK